MIRRLISSLLLVVLLPFMAFAAGDSTMVTLRGLVTESGGGRKLPDVQVHVVGTHVATMTNADGRFILRLPKMPDQLLISAIGFSTVTVNRAELQATQRPDDKDEPVAELRIQLEPRFTLLNDVFVYSPENILAAAIERIHANYPLAPQSYEAFYRETIRKRNKYVSVSEAVMELYKTSYEESPWRDMACVVKGRSLISQRARDTISVHVMGGPLESLMLDLVKNREIFLSPEMLEYYALEIETPQTIDERPQYVIAFHPARSHVDPLFYGRIYIDYDNLAFTRIEYDMDMSDVAKASAAILAKKPFGMRFKARGLHIVMNYHYDGRLSHLRYLGVTYKFDCDWKKRGFATHYEATSEMLITDIKPVAIRPNRRDAFKQHDTLGRELKDFDDPDFWSDYNILLPTESLEHAFRRIKKTYDD